MAVKGTIGTLSTFGGNPDVWGNPSNGGNAIAYRNNNGNTNNMTGNQKQSNAGQTRTPTTNQGNKGVPSENDQQNNDNKNTGDSLMRGPTMDLVKQTDGYMNSRDIAEMKIKAFLNDPSGGEN